MKELDTKLRHILENNIPLLEKSLDSFERSLEKCTKIGVTKEFSFEESESFDAFSSKFARLSDIYTQKVIKGGMMLLREEALTFIDRINTAEKFGFIRSAEDLKLIRDLRNEIAHEYVLEDLYQLYADLLEFSEMLLVNIHLQIKYFKNT